MASYFFHGSGEEATFIAPAPPEYVDFSQRRAVWEALGLRKSEMSARDWFHVLAFLRAEAQNRKASK